MSNENEQEATKPVEQGSAQAAGKGGCGGNCGNCKRHCAPRGKLHCYNWLEDIPGGYADDDMVEVQFKNTRKGYYKNSTNIPLSIGDMVAVEASPGHDIGQVTLTGALVRLQMRKANIKPNAEVRRVFRIAKPADLEKYEEARARENDTMIRARKIAEDLKLNMKIGDVEYQGDGNKAIFYYIADERVDFRQLIKVLADAFKVRIEMKQIGARQEAGRIGGIGPCGRPLCCASWMTSFVSVATSAARFQDISLNPQKLAGQCAKLKCCLNFEVDAYVEMSKKLPPKTARLETADATYYHFKTDIFKREITYSTDKSIAANLVTLDPERVFEIIEMNKKGEKPLSLQRDGNEQPKAKSGYNDLLDQDELTRFDSKRRKKKKKKPNKPKADIQNNDTPRNDKNE
jgi:cell fate regulator YaaT (PSP1 superfamily)